jgi:pilus assembly protein Flp/PilA
MKVVGWLEQLMHQEDGADATEYALVAALISLAVIGGAQLMGESINAVLSAFGTRIQAESTKAGL